MKTIRLLLILASIFASSCVLKPTEDVYLPEDAKQYLMYNSGSYVVLKNDSLNITDTISTVNAKYTWKNYYNNETYENYNCEQVKVEYYSSYYKVSVFDILDYILDPSEYAFRLSRIDINNNFSISTDYFFYKRIDLDINLNKYNNVLFSDRIRNNDTTWASYYFAPNIGLIRKIYHYPSHEMKWDMVSYYNSGQPAKE